MESVIFHVSARNFPLNGTSTLACLLKPLLYLKVGTDYGVQKYTSLAVPPPHRRGTASYLLFRK